MARDSSMTRAARARRAAPYVGLMAIMIGLAGCHAQHPPKTDFASTLPEEIPAVGDASGAIYQAGHDQGLFDNAVARRVGDILTIQLQESTNASKSAVTTTKKNTTATLPGANILGGTLTIHGRNVLSGSLADSSAFDGEGTSAQSNQLSGYISVTVAKRLANGNLLVRGQKWLTLNQGREYVQIQGIVRPMDIGPDNIVPSYAVADAAISYGGQGTLADSNTKSWLARFFDSPYMPF
ncbi:MAG: flagellar basal body L-ring protein FlgH [Steroidobacterales bacterium]